MTIEVTTTRAPTPATTAAPAQPPIIFGSPLIGEAEIAEVVDTLRSGWLGTGPKTKRFEAEFAEYVGTKYAIATNSATAALHLALDGLSIGPGDEVITTPLTFVATANVIEHCGATPVFADVSLHDGNVDPAAVEAKITNRTKAILPVHYAGAVAPVGALRARCPRLPIVTDAAHAVESRFESGASSASEGATCAAYSFYVTKNLVTGEGGMLVTDDTFLAERARIRSLHGLTNDAWARYARGTYGRYDLVYPGFKYNMTDIQASLGLHQLARIEESLLRRREIWEHYNEAFADLPGIELPEVALAHDRSGRHAMHLYAIWCDWEALNTTRQQFVETLRDLGVGTGWHFRALHLQPYYAKKYGYLEGTFPVAERIAERTISLPLSAALRDADVLRVVDAVTRAVTAAW